jgi:hypothetical protein
MYQTGSQKSQSFVDLPLTYCRILNSLHFLHEGQFLHLHHVGFEGALLDITEVVSLNPSSALNSLT